MEKETKTATFRMRMNPQTKEQAEQLFYSCGMTMSGAIGLFLMQSLNANGLPFSVTERTAADFDAIAE